MRQKYNCFYHLVEKHSHLFKIKTFFTNIRPNTKKHRPIKYLSSKGLTFNRIDKELRMQLFGSLKQKANKKLFLVTVTYLLVCCIDVTMVNNSCPQSVKKNDIQITYFFSSLCFKIIVCFVASPVD